MVNHCGACGAVLFVCKATLFAPGCTTFPTVLSVKNQGTIREKHIVNDIMSIENFNIQTSIVMPKMNLI